MDIPDITGEGEFDFIPSKFLVSSSNLNTNSALIVVKENDGSSGSDYLERYGGWNLASDNGTWYQYNFVPDLWTEWHGDDDDCDIITRSERNY